jgi:peptidoglycan/LPS O-acetylase OafA/YrhL
MGSSPERFHALDATRAYALLVVIVFHAAWSFVPASFGAPLMDASAHRFFDWFFFTTHTFPMQLFFLIAGFFAHLLFHRRGVAAFTGNRLLRIGVPLLVGWLVLYPLLMAAWTFGGNRSGSNLVPVPLSTLFASIYEERLGLVPQTSGGMFCSWHLWFLYYLLWLYALILGIRWLLTRSEFVTHRLQGWADRWVGRAMRSPSSIVWLTLGVGLSLWPMGSWFGSDTPMETLTPSAPVLVHYAAFFAFGWLLHRQPGLLQGLGRHWRWQLPLGLALSIPLFAGYVSARDRGVINQTYPKLSSTQITEWPAFLKRLQAGRNPAEAPAERTHLWAHLPPVAAEKILALSADAGAYQRVGVAKELGKLLRQPALFRPEPTPVGFKPSPGEADRALIENRAKLDQLFAGSLTGDRRKLGWYQPAKLAFSTGYSLVLWLLLFGTLGIFQAQCPGHSPAWRYVADSSYWIYLAHLPLVAALQIWMAPWPWPGILKFFLLNAIAFAILFASYHYLVRSTFIGRILNGRAHPFVAWPYGRRGTRATRTARGIS